MFTEEVIPQTPIPDYEEVVNSPENQNVFSFAKKFQNVLTSIQKIGKIHTIGSFVKRNTTLSLVEGVSAHYV